MFKISSYALTMALLTHGLPRADAACDGVISSFAGECTYANFLANLNGDCDVTTMFEPEADPAAEVAMLCEYDAPVQFVEIQGTYQLDRRYFAGGGPLVDGANYAIDSARLARFESNIGSGSSLISFPQYAARVNYNINNGLGTNGYPANMNLETSCDLNTVMCCFTDGSFPSTTDVCRHNLHDSPQSNHIKDGWSVFPGDESSTHCVGFTWTDGGEELLGNMMYDVSYRQTALHGYKEGVPGAPMCGCVEHMPTVEEASCRTATKTGEITYSFEYNAAEGYVTASNAASITYSDCAAGDLKAQFIANGGDAAAMDEHLVGADGCEDDLVEYLNEEQFLHVGQHATKYIAPDENQWSDLVVGEGIYFLPPHIDPIKSDNEFRDLINAGCLEADGVTPRACIIRRVCSSCNSEAHRDIYYKRLTDLPPAGTNTTAGEVYFLEVFMNQWRSNQNNMANGDFQLFSTYQDALDGTNAWTYCNYDYNNVGFPRDCGPNGRAHNEWNSYVRGGGYANHHGFYVEKP